MLASIVLAGGAGVVASPAGAALDGPRIAPDVASTTYLVARANVPERGIVLRSRPGGRALARVGAWTQFGGRPGLAVVEERDGWLGVSAPDLPNGRLGWVRRETMRISLTRVSLVADLSRRTLALEVGGRVVKRIRVAVGAPGTSTPTGRYAVTDKVPGEVYGAYYGCCILALSGHQPNLPVGWRGGDLLGIHGTDTPWTIGTASSAGCLRASDADLRVLMRRVPVGTPVFIHP